MSSIDNTGGIERATSAIDLGHSGSLQFQFAKLQLALAEISKTGAMSYIEEIQKSQDEQKNVAAMIQEIRNLQENGCERTIAMMDGKSYTISPDNVLVSWETSKYMVDNGLAVTGDIQKYKAVYAMDEAAAKQQDPALMYTSIRNGVTVPQKNLDVLITSLQGKLDSLGTDTQQKMIFVQDYMGQYNSYLTGSNSVIQQANQTLAELAKAY